MKIKIWPAVSALTAIFLLFAGSVLAQNTDSVKEIYVLKGKVSDAETGEGIPFANVSLNYREKNVGRAETNNDGIFSIEVSDEEIDSVNLAIDVERPRDKATRTEILDYGNICYVKRTILVIETIISCGLRPMPLFFQDPNIRTYTREDFRRRFR